MAQSLVFVGIQSQDTSPESTPQAIEKVAQLATEQALQIQQQDTISIYNTDGTSFNSVRLLNGSPTAPLVTMEISENDFCESVSDPMYIESGLRELDGRADLSGKAYLRTTFNRDTLTPEFQVCKPLR